MFPTVRGKQGGLQNVRRRLLVPAIEKANPKLIEAKVKPIGQLTLRGLRRLFATLRTISGERPVDVADLMGHIGPDVHAEDVSPGREAPPTTAEGGAEGLRRRP